MRIPWYIYTPLTLIVTYVTLYLCIKDNDINTPPSPEATAQSLHSWKENNPSLRNIDLNTAPTKQADNSPKQANTKTTPEHHPENKPQITTTTTPQASPQTSTKTLETSPSLDSLIDLNLTTTQLTTYAVNMLKLNKPQLARIAYERVIDSAKDATTDDRKSAATNISTLKNKTPLWNPDPSTRKKLTITITLDPAFTTESKPIISELQQLIFDSADGTITPTIKLTTSKDAHSSLNLGDGSPIVKFKPENKADLLAKIHTAIYYSISTKNNQSQKITTIPSIPMDISPKQSLQTYITRLAWSNAAQ